MAVTAVGAADYALAAHHMAPAVLANPVSLRGFQRELLVAAGTMLLFPAVYALQVGHH